MEFAIFHRFPINSTEPEISTFKNPSVQGREYFSRINMSLDVTEGFRNDSEQKYISFTIAVRVCAKSSANKSVSC